VGWSDLGWAMENLWAVSMGRQFFCMSTVGPPNKNGEQLSIVIGDEFVGQLGANMYVNTVMPVYIYNVHTCKFFYYKSVFSQFRLGGWVMK
jgi:hypothetical protein